jgi:hypothetical protein
MVGIFFFQKIDSCFYVVKINRRGANLLRLRDEVLAAPSVKALFE